MNPGSRVFPGIALTTASRQSRLPASLRQTGGVMSSTASYYGDAALTTSFYMESRFPPLLVWCKANCHTSYPLFLSALILGQDPTNKLARLATYMPLGS